MATWIWAKVLIKSTYKDTSHKALQAGLFIRLGPGFCHRKCIVGTFTISADKVDIYAETLPYMFNVVVREKFMSVAHRHMEIFRLFVFHKCFLAYNCHQHRDTLGQDDILDPRPRISHYYPNQDSYYESRWPSKISYMCYVHPSSNVLNGALCTAVSSFTYNHKLPNLKSLA